MLRHNMKNLALLCLLSITSLFSYAQSESVNQKQLNALINDIESYISQNWDQSFETIQEKFSLENVSKNYGIDFKAVFEPYRETAGYNELLELDSRVSRLFSSYTEGSGTTNERKAYTYSVWRYTNFMIIDKVVEDLGLNLVAGKYNAELTVDLAESLTGGYYEELIKNQNKFEKKVPRVYGFTRSLFGRILSSIAAGGLGGTFLGAFSGALIIGANTIMSLGELMYPYGSSPSLSTSFALLVGIISGTYFAVQEFKNSKLPAWNELSKLEQKEMIWERISKHQKRYLEKVVKDKYPGYSFEKYSDVSDIFNPQVRYKLEYLWENEASTPQEKIDLIKKYNDEMISKLKCEGLFNS